MAEIQISTSRPEGHSLLTICRLARINREQHRSLLHFAGDDWSAVVELTPEETQILSAAIQLLDAYPTVREVTA